MTIRLGDDAPDFSAQTTEGPINFHEWIGDGWAVLFSHPKNFTPVCTTELGYMAGIKDKFDQRGVKVIGLSVDPLDSHDEWAKDIEETQVNALNFPLIAIEGLLVGAVTGFVGAGGGFLIIPALVILAGLSMKQAVSTSLMIIAFKSLLGFVGDIQAGLMIDWMLLFQVVGLSIVGVFIGERISRKVDGNKLKPAFGYFVLLMGLGILLREII